MKVKLDNIFLSTAQILPLFHQSLNLNNSHTCTIFQQAIIFFFCFFWQFWFKIRHTSKSSINRNHLCWLVKDLCLHSFSNNWLQYIQIHNTETICKEIKMWQIFKLVCFKCEHQKSYVFPKTKDLILLIQIWSGLLGQSDIDSCIHMEVSKIYLKEWPG